MSARSFRLGSVLRARRRELDVAQARLADEMRKKAHAMRLHNHSLTQLQDASHQLHDRLSRGASAAMLRAVDGAMELAHASAVRAGEVAAAKDEAIEIARQAITDAKKRLRSIEILEERWQDRLRTERAKTEQKRLDEIATQAGGGASR